MAYISEDSKVHPELMHWEQKELDPESLDEYIGKGSSAGIYKGFYQGNAVAIKILIRQNLRNLVAVARFRREAEVLQQINHANIIKIIDMGYTEKGTYFIIMEHFDGETVESLLQQEHRLSIAEAIEITIQAARGLREVHAKELVHRDIKPSNILYDRASRQVKVIDFGIAREISGDSLVTQQGYIVGTPDYMSPEQCRCTHIDSRTDIYSLGVTLYHMLTGRTPFQNKMEVCQIILAHTSEPISWPTNLCSIPFELRKIVGRMLDKQVQNRTKSMDEVIAQLTEFIAEYNIY